MDRINGANSNQASFIHGTGILVQCKEAAETPHTPADSVDVRHRPLAELMDEQTLRAFMHDIPKIDLHRHLEGTIDPETLLNIAARRSDFVNLPSYDVEGLRNHLQVNSQDKTLIDFLRKFETIGKAFTDKEAVEEVTYDSIHQAAKDHVDYCELRFSPVYMASHYGISEEDVMNGVLDGVQRAQKDFDTEIKLIMIVERQMGTEHAAHVEEMAEKYMDKGVVGLDLANDEFHFPPGPYAKVFQKAKDAGLHVTVHAGEAAGAENVKVSIEELKADRIGHGVRTFEDPAVEKLVHDKHVTLEMCPTSNVQTGATDSFEHHPFKRYYEEDIPVTINTDDPGISGITLTDEYTVMVEKFGFSFDDVQKFLMNSIDAAFLPKEEKEAMRAKFKTEMDQVAEQYLLSDGKKG